MLPYYLNPCHGTLIHNVKFKNNMLPIYLNDKEGIQVSRNKEFLFWCCTNMCSNYRHHCVKVSDKYRLYHVNTLLYCDQCLPYLHFQFHNHPGYYTSALFELPPFCLLYICQIKLASDYSMSILLSCYTLSCPDYSLSAPLCCQVLSCPDYSLSAPLCFQVLSCPDYSLSAPLCCQVLSCLDYSLSALFMLSSPELSWLLSIGPF